MEREVSEGGQKTWGERQIRKWSGGAGGEMKTSHFPFGWDGRFVLGEKEAHSPLNLAEVHRFGEFLDRCGPG